MILRLDRLKTILLLLLIGLPILCAAVEYQYHRVKQGDTLYGLGKRYGVSVAQLKRLNNLSSDALSLNQSLKIKEKPKPKPAPKPAPQVNPATTPDAVPMPALPQINPDGSRVLSDDYYYTVVPKDGLYGIARRHGITLNELLLYNKFESSSHPIRPGDKIIIKNPGISVAPASGTETPEKPESADTPRIENQPATNAAASDTVIVEKVYIVQPKDTLYRIATNYGITVDELKRRNNLESNDISVGQRLYIVGNAKPGEYTKTTSAPPVSTVPGKDRTDLIMPINGRISSPYGIRGGKPHKGLDISAKAGTPIYAVLDGTVVYSGVQGGYGNVVVLEHPNFVMTLYAHNERNLVKVGDVVSKGQQIAACGSTGDSTGTHCHFEYRVKGKPINPNRVLPID